MQTRATARAVILSGCGGAIGKQHLLWPAVTSPEKCLHFLVVSALSFSGKVTAGSETEVADAGYTDEVIATQECLIGVLKLVS